MDNPNEKISEKENNSQCQKPKTCQMAKSSLGLAVVSFLIIIGTLIIANVPWVENLPKWCFVPIPYSILFFLIIYPLSVILGIVGIFRVRKSKGQLKGIRLAMGGMAINLATAATIIATIIMFVIPVAHQMMCGMNIEGLGKAMTLYASDYNDDYPTADKWCDLLIEHEDSGPRQFICRGSDAVEGESSYAFNKYLVGKKVSNVDWDIVVLFETNFGKETGDRQELLRSRDFYKFADLSKNQTYRDYIKQYPESQKVYKSRWNQVGGPEILTTDNHKGKACMVLFNDSHVDFIKTEKLKDLKWKPEEDK